jgi:hypothetical protein
MVCFTDKMLMRCFREFSALCILALEPVIACGMNMDREDGNVHNKSGVYSTGGEILVFVMK